VTPCYYNIINTSLLFQFQINKEPPTSQIPNIGTEARKIQGTTTYDIQKTKKPESNMIAALSASTSVQTPLPFQTNKEPPTSQIPNIGKEARKIQGTTTYDIQKSKKPESNMVATHPHAHQHRHHTTRDRAPLKIQRRKK
jgi:hypothetical protein